VPAEDQRFLMPCGPSTDQGDCILIRPSWPMAAATDENRACPAKLGSCGRAVATRAISFQAYSRDAFNLQEGVRARSSVSDSDRGCPLGTGVVRPMWHAGGTAGEEKIRADAAAMVTRTTGG
jgi:hypothetical protein